MTFLTGSEKDENGPRSHMQFSVPTGGLGGATIIDSLDTLYLMELKEEFQEAKAWVQDSFHLNVVSQRSRGDGPVSSSTGGTLVPGVIQQSILAVGLAPSWCPLVRGETARAILPLPSPRFSSWACCSARDRKGNGFVRGKRPGGPENWTGEWRKASRPLEPQSPHQARKDDHDRGL